MKELNTNLVKKIFYGTVNDIIIDQETGIAYVTVKLPDGTLVGGIRPKEDPTDNPIDISQIDYKLLKHTDNSTSAVQIGEEQISVIGSEKHRFVSTKRYGNFIVGPTTFTAHPESVRIGGVFRFNGLLTSTMPSTIVTPISTLVLDLPGKNLIKELKSTLLEYKTILGL
jgi:hypothetical protein